ncbi:MAG: alanine--glyoxylate aminotransferase family protein [Myxococcota bacterium]
MRLQKHRLLMIPGPTEIAYESLLAMAQPSIVHYGDDYVDRHHHVMESLQKIFQTTQSVMMIPGSSSIAMEAAVNAAVEPGHKILIPGGGMFADRFKEMAVNCGSHVVPLEVEWCRPLMPDRVASALDTDPDIRVMAAIHNETSTGVTHPMEEIAEVCREREVSLILDTVTSLGGIEVRSDAWGLDYCMSGNHKCLESPSGTGLIMISERAWKRMEARKTPIHGWFLNLMNLREYAERFASWHPSGPVSTPTHVVAALEVSLDAMLSEGLDNRFRRHALCAKAFRAGMRAMGIELLVEDTYASNTITSFMVPEKATDAETIRLMRDEFDIIIANSHHPNLLGKMLRVGHMGQTANRNCLLLVLTALAECFRLQGAKVSSPDAMDAALEVFRDQPK